MEKNKEQPKWTLERQVGRDMHAYIFNEAICPHGIGHHKGVHGCDVVKGRSCCVDCPKELWDMVTED